MSINQNVEEYVILVNEQDEMIGLEEKMRAHELGLLHRAFSICVYRRTETGTEILLQQRAHEKYHCGGLWTNTCCSHPRENETVMEAANRRLYEEMSFNVPLTEIGTFLYKAAFDNGLTEHELDHVLIGEYANFHPIFFNKEEVASYQWIEINELLNELKTTPEKFTPWFKPALDLALARL